ncbi:MAG: hypothetical protein ABJN69_07975 [Hellea sp.]
MISCLKEMLHDLGLHEKWTTANIVDQTFVETQYARLPDPDAEHIRMQFYEKFFKDRQGSPISDADVRVYLKLADLETDAGLKSWAIGFLVECGNISETQLIALNQNQMLEPKHKLFLARELKFIGGLP